MLRHPAEISLGEVYRAVSHEDLLSMHQHPNPDCMIGGNIQEVLCIVFDDAQKAMEAALDKFSVATILEKVLLEDAQQQRSSEV